jgi:hypothetical protein
MEREELQEEGDNTKQYISRKTNLHSSLHARNEATGVNAAVSALHDLTVEEGLHLYVYVYVRTCETDEFACESPTQNNNNETLPAACPARSPQLCPQTTL